MSSWRILVVDDEPGVVRGIERILSGTHEVFTSNSAPEAVELAREMQPDLAIVDIRMPHMDGFELMERLQAEHERIEVILMTGSVSDTDEKLIKAIRGKAFYYLTKPFERGVLLALIDRCLEMKRLEQADREHADLMRRQLMSAYAFQKSMLPTGRASLEGLEIRAAYYPCEHVAGDFYDYAVSGTGKVTLLIADVVGHGASAAMLTAVVKSAFNKSRADGYDPLAVLTNVTTDMAAFEPDQFLTLLCARLSRTERTIEYVNAGHVDGLIIGGDGRIAHLEATCPIVTPIVRDSNRERKTIEWPPDSRLLLYTDGISEAWQGDTMLGTDRLHEIIRETQGNGDNLLQNLYETVGHYRNGSPQSDDITLLLAWSAE